MIMSEISQDSWESYSVGEDAQNKKQSLTPRSREKQSLTPRSRAKEKTATFGSENDQIINPITSQDPAGESESATKV
jgi:hypothetical protein